MTAVSRTEDPSARAERLIHELREATAEAAGVLKDLIAAKDAVIKVTATLTADVVANEVQLTLAPLLERIGARMEALDASIVAEFNKDMEDLRAVMRQMIEQQGTIVITSYSTTREKMEEDGTWPVDLT